MVLDSIAPLTAGLMMRSSGDEEVMRRSQPYHRAAFEAIRERDPEAAREAIEAHLSVARDMYDEDYERSVDSLAQRSLAEAGYSGTLDELVAAVFRARRDGHDDPEPAEDAAREGAGG